MSYCVVRCWCCTTPCTTLYDASYIPDASGPDALYDTVRRVVRSRRVGPRRLVRRPDASYNAFPTALAEGVRGAEGGLEREGWGEQVSWCRKGYAECPNSPQIKRRVFKWANTATTDDQGGP